MNRIGIRAHDIGRLDPVTLASRIGAYGFDGVQLVFSKALSQPVDFTDVSLIRKAFRKLKIMMLGAYFNPVHPDLDVVKAGIANFKKHLQIARSLECDLVGSETGSLMGSPWGYLPENHEEGTLEKVIAVFGDLVKIAKSEEVNVAIEGAWAHVAYSPQRIRTVLDRIDSPNLKVTVDLFNYLYPGNHEERMEILAQCFDLFRDRIRIFHLKDYIVREGKLVQVGLGKGIMDWNAIIRSIRKQTPEAYLIFEGVTGDDIKTSYELISRIVKEE